MDGRVKSAGAAGAGIGEDEEKGRKNAGLGSWNAGIMPVLWKKM